MSKTDASEIALLEAIFFNSAFGTLLAPGAATHLYVSLHTANPGDASNQLTSEVTYAGYARVALARNAGAWTRTANNMRPYSYIDFPICTAGPAQTATYYGVGTDATGAGLLLYKGLLSPSILINLDVTPRLTTNTTVSED